MKLVPLHASLISLAVFAAAPFATAGTAASAEPMRLAQAETEVAAPDLEQIRRFLAGGRDLSRLDDERLQQRLTRAKRLERTEGLPPEMAQELAQEISALNAEIERRQQAAAPQPEAQPEPQPELQQQAQPEPQPEPEQQAQPQPQPQQQEQPKASGEVAAFLESVRPADQLDEDALRQQMRQAMELARSEDLSPDQRRALRAVIRDARTALRSGNNGDTAAETQTPPQPPPAQQQDQQQAQQPAAEQPPAQPEQQMTVDPALERQARALLRDDADVRDMSRRELRQRLSGMRDLLASGQLSPETREALRKKLAAERQVLRREVRQERQEDSGQGQRPAQGGGNTTSNTNTNTNVNTNVNNTDVRVVLEDRRPPSALEDDELIRRIDIYREVIRDQRYAEAEREAWRRALERDRRYLRRQMLEERQARAERLRRGDFELEFQIDNDYDPDYAYRDDVFAAEVDDEELERVIVAPPRRKVERRYTVDEIERSPVARDAVARIEIDTVNFGFGEGFLREEEIEKLDRIARVLERILAKTPEEVFLLEGHTDAVGSDASNLRLSRERAAAVKEALTTYYVIPEENLKTVGLGERYLKIPTLQAEAENRRVSLARITALVGELD